MPRQCIGNCGRLNCTHYLSKFALSSLCFVYDKDPMKDHLINDIITALPKDRTLYYYFKDRYALTLLSSVVGEGITVRAIKQSRFAPLLARPLLKQLIATAGNGQITHQDLANLWPIAPVCYRLTVGKWGVETGPSWQQTTRPEPNLVLHLNFSNQHDQAYKALIENKGLKPFIYRDHPNARAGFNTLSWARFDVDFQSGQALIEELQTDWLRYVKWCTAYVERQDEAEEEVKFGGVPIKRNDLRRYVSEVIAPHMKLWDQATLSAAVWFLRAELNIKTIYMHEADCGAKLKQIVGKAPPRSLYTDLPKKFCFQPVTVGPEFLYKKASRTFRRLKKTKELRFWRLDLP